MKRLFYNPDCPGPPEGRFAIVTIRWAWMQWTRQSQAWFAHPKGCVRQAGRRSAAYGEIAWSWRRDPGVYPARLCRLGNGGKKGRSPGRSRISRKPVARGKPGCPGLYLSNPCASFSLRSSTRQCGRSRRPAFPASSVQGTTNWQASGDNCAVSTKIHAIASKAHKIRFNSYGSPRAK